MLLRRRVITAIATVTELEVVVVVEDAAEADMSSNFGIF